MRSKRFAAGLFITTALSTIALETPAFAEYSFDQTFDAYAWSGYNYCDAKMVGMLWNQDVTQGKAIIGNKILNGIGEDIPLILAESRAAYNRCNWEDTAYDYDDALAVARAWNLGSVADAKGTIAFKVTNGDSYMIEQALGR
ncbi:hypothetical protein AZE99_09745 [Sphingorhabdus sp. M41]|nr:hypothetical protein AZE99_09745 [Sphingorhabdus sp. M41]